MKRYCTNCKQSFDFRIRSMDDLENLQCPVCHNKIDKNSCAPIDHTDSDRAANNIAHTLQIFARINYVFFAAVSIVGLFGYFFHWDKVLYISTGTCLAVFLIQLLTGLCSFRSGILFLPIGAAAGYFFLKSVRGACLGVLAVFLIRHLLRDIFYTLICKLIRLATK